MNVNEEGLKYFEALLNIRKAMIVRLQDASDQVLGFIYQIITIAGVVASFGFTAINYANRFFFVLGESGLFICIVSSLLAVRHFWISGLSSTEKFNNEVSSRSAALKIALQKRDESGIQKIIDELNAPSLESAPVAKKVELILTMIIVTFVVSCFFLLGSFLANGHDHTLRSEMS